MQKLLLALRTDLLARGDAAAVDSIDGPGRWRSPDGRCMVALATSPSGIERPGEAADAARRIGDAYAVDPTRWPTVGDAPCVGVIVDLDRRHALAGVDEAGLHQLYWEQLGDRLLLSNRLGDLVEARGGPPRLDPQAIYDYVYFHCIPSPRTIYAGVSKLPAGHLLRQQGRTLELRRHFNVQFALDSDPSPEALGRELLDVLDQSVRRAMRTGVSQGAFLSGGLDSSTVAGMLARHCGDRPAPTFSIGFDAEGYDEIEYARIAARHFGTDAREYYVTPDDIHSTVRQIAGAFDEPFGNSSAIPVYFCAQLARRAGIERMLAGDGGDELFAGNSRYAKQMVFERYGAVPVALRTALLEPVLLGSPAGRLPGIGKVASYVRQAKVRLPDRLQSYNYLHRHDPARIFPAPLLGHVDQAEPIALLRSEYDVHADAAAVDRMLFLDWKFTLHDNDLVKVNRMCGLAGVDVGYPMLDVDLVRFSCRVPASLKLHRNELRWFYKHAARGFLPDEIIRKKKHGFGLPFGVWLKEHSGLRQLAADALSSLGERGLFEPGFLVELQRLHSEVHAAYYGEMVWVLMMLELWLEARGVPAGGVA